MVTVEATKFLSPKQEKQKKRSLDVWYGELPISFSYLGPGPSIEPFSMDTWPNLSLKL